MFHIFNTTGMMAANSNDDDEFLHIALMKSYYHIYNIFLKYLTGWELFSFSRKLRNKYISFKVSLLVRET